MPWLGVAGRAGSSARRSGGLLRRPQSRRPPGGLSRRGPSVPGIRRIHPRPQRGGLRRSGPGGPHPARGAGIGRSLRRLLVVSRPQADAARLGRTPRPEPHPAAWHPAAVVDRPGPALRAGRPRMPRRPRPPVAHRRADRKPGPPARSGVMLTASRCGRTAIWSAASSASGSDRSSAWTRCSSTVPVPRGSR